MINVNVENDAKEKLAFLKVYRGSEEVNVIEPLYDNLKSGEKVKFKLKSNLEEMIIKDEEWNKLKKNESGFFELEITIQTQNGDNVIIAKPKGTNNCSSLISYNII